jgi:Family of unknown function (DUF5996)
VTRGRWPSIPVAEWQDTRDTLHLYSQVVGKVRLANEPLTNHWWNVPLYVTARGLTTSLMPHPTGPAFQIDFDFVEHRLDVATVNGDRRVLGLQPRAVADFYGALMALLDELGVGTEIWRPRCRRHPLLGSTRPAPSRGRAELRTARDAGGLLPRGQQLRLLARPAR